MNLSHKLGMSRARNIATALSHDPDTKTGCVIYSFSGIWLADGANRIPNPIIARPEMLVRPAKYNWIEHSERDAIFNNTDVVPLMAGGTMYLNWFPCADCARAIVAVGIEALVYIIKADRLADPRYGFEASRAILEAGGVKLIEYAEGE